MLLRHSHFHILCREGHLTSNPVILLVQAVIRHANHIRCICFDGICLLIAARRQLVQPEWLSPAFAGPFFEGDYLSGTRMGDLLHIEWQRYRLPSFRLHETRLHLVIMGVGDALCCEGLRTIEVITVQRFLQDDVLGSTIYNQILDGPKVILLILHIEQQVGVCHLCSEWHSWVPDDSRKLVTAFQRIFLNACHFPRIVHIRYGGGYIQPVSVVAWCHYDLPGILGRDKIVDAVDGEGYLQLVECHTDVHIGSDILDKVLIVNDARCQVVAVHLERLDHIVSVRSECDHGVHSFVHIIRFRLITEHILTHHDITISLCVDVQDILVDGNLLILHFHYRVMHHLLDGVEIVGHLRRHVNTIHQHRPDTPFLVWIKRNGNGLTFLYPVDHRCIHDHLFTIFRCSLTY